MSTAPSPHRKAADVAVAALDASAACAPRVVDAHSADTRRSGSAGLRGVMTMIDLTVPEQVQRAVPQVTATIDLTGPEYERIEGSLVAGSHPAPRSDASVVPTLSRGGRVSEGTGSSGAPAVASAVRPPAKSNQPACPPVYRVYGQAVDFAEL